MNIATEQLPKPMIFDLDNLCLTCKKAKWIAGPGDFHHLPKRMPSLHITSRPGFVSKEDVCQIIRSYINNWGKEEMVIFSYCPKHKSLGWPRSKMLGCKDRVIG